MEMTKTLQQIKDEVRNEGLRDDWVDQVAIRYAQEQNKELHAWKKTASTILNRIDLQELGKLLGMQYGTSISEQLLPRVEMLVEHNKELLEMLEIINEGINTMEFTQLEVLHNEIESLITKHKQS